MDNRHHSVEPIDGCPPRILKWSWEVDHLKKAVKKAAPEVGATEFKARCLQIMNAVHDRKLNSVIVTKRGKPFVKLVPVPEEPNLVYGSLAGLAKVVGDLTEPVDVIWEAERE
jgi:prevent-host-death family protein